MLRALLLLSCLVASAMCIYVSGNRYGYPMRRLGVHSMLRRPFRHWERSDYDSDWMYGDSLFDRDLDRDMDNHRYLARLGYGV